jgi:type IX secretion system PorP/SprF family membrane protein
MKEDMKKIMIIITAVIGMQTVSFAQQDPHFTQYFDNTLFVNPAYAGSRGMLNVTGIHREQWMGFAGRPVSSTLSIHSPLSYESVGLGLTVVNDQAGPVKQTMFYGDFSYTVRFGTSNAKLSFGIKGGMNLINIGTASLQTTSADDPKLVQNVRNSINPNFGGGIYFHTPAFFIGASSPKILEQSYDGSETNIEKRHYFGIIGGVIPMGDHWKLRPTAQAKLTQGAPMSLDMSLATIFREKFWIGAMYRYDAAFGAFVQYQITPQFKLGLASDFGTQAIRNYNYGTFEIMGSYDFVFRKEGIRSPRYF